MFVRHAFRSEGCKEYAWLLKHLYNSDESMVYGVSSITVSTPLSVLYKYPRHQTFLKQRFRSNL
jgi:hypothetical protein